MASVGAKKRAKQARRRAQAGPGAPRQAGRERYASGRVKARPQEEREADIKRTVSEARVRVFGVDPKDADKPESGSAIGRLLTGNHLAVSAAQRESFKEAAHHFHETRRAADSAILSKTLTTATNYTGTRSGGGTSEDGDDPSYVDWCNKVRRRYADVRRAVLECGDPQAMMALEMCILEDRQPYSDIMLGSLRCGLNAVDRVRRNARGKD